MDTTWHSPDSWQKDGASISGVENLKTKAWTSTLKATETHDGKTTEVMIKAFTPPAAAADAGQDEPRIAAEREKFLASARLQYSLTQAGEKGAAARAWVKILRLSDDPKNPSFSMEKCGPSARDLIDNRVNLSAKDLYALVLAVVQALMELKARHNRSHGNIKPSDVLSSLPGQTPLYKLTDPAAKGEDHSANDLFSLGLVIYQLIEHRDWDPLNPIMPVRAWNRFGAKRDRWIQFCNMLLNPNGCHEPLADVRREALRLKPGSPLRYAVLAAGMLALVGAGAVGYHFFVARWLQPPAATNPMAGIDSQVKAAYDDARKAFRDASQKYNALNLTARYDHGKSTALARDARGMIIDQATITDEPAYRAATDAYKKATAKMLEALAQAANEEQGGKQGDSQVFTDLAKAQDEYAQAKTRWDSAVAGFTAGRDHMRSEALAQAATMPSRPAPSDAASAVALAAQYRQSVEKLNQAILLVPDEEKSGASQDDARAAFEAARTAYQQAQNQFAAAEQTAGSALDLTAARAAAAEARKLLPDQIVLSDAASYRSTTDLYKKAAAQYQQAVALIDKEKQGSTQKQQEIAAAVAKANQALKDQKYADALAGYKSAAELGNAPAMQNVGLLYETGQGTTRDYAEAARWYRRAADLGQSGAMYDLAYLYETGQGVDKDFAAAAGWYKKAAEAKDIQSMNHLGYFYENGWGVPQDFAEAMKWYRMAADLNDSTAIGNIGVLFDKGRGVKADPVEAMKWYKKAADLGNAAAINDVGVLYDNGRGVKADPVEAMKWYKKAADLNYAPAMCNVGVLYDNGLGVPVNHTEAMTWFKKAAALNHGLAMYNIAFLYETGRGVAPDIVQAVQWYRKAFKSDDESASQLAGQALDRLGYAHQ